MIESPMYCDHLFELFDDPRSGLGNTTKSFYAGLSAIRHRYSIILDFPGGDVSRSMLHFISTEVNVHHVNIVKWPRMPGVLSF